VSDLNGLRVERRGGAAWVTLDRPDALNALTYPMLTDLAAALSDLSADDTVRAVAITGSGRAFCAGADTKGLEERQDTDPATRRERVVEFGQSPALLHTMAKPTIAIINGAAVGAGLGLALACDVRIGSSGAMLRPGFARIGTSGDFGVPWLLALHLGASAAAAHLLLDTEWTGSEAFAAGLLHELVEPDDLAERAHVVVNALASGPTFAFAKMKANVADARVLGLAEAIGPEATRMVQTIGTSDHREAIAALRDKRAAQFTGT
jgi:2-(1,2-epoxy-1,2-dihydrophenyl)acetyl-CoA isomerase